jgi:hypothetical protein
LIKEWEQEQEAGREGFYEKGYRLSLIWKPLIQNSTSSLSLSNFQHEHMYPFAFPPATNTTCTAANLYLLAEGLQLSLQDTYVDVAAKISILLPCVSKARTNANSAVNRAMIPSRTLRDDTILSTMIEPRGSKDDMIVARIEIPVCKCDSEYCDISEGGSSGSGFCSNH